MLVVQKIIDYSRITPSQMSDLEYLLHTMLWLSVYATAGFL